MRTLLTSFFAFAVSLSAADTTKAELRIPVAKPKAMLIDGKITDREWADAQRTPIHADVVLLSKQFDGTVYLAIQAKQSRWAFVDLYLVDSTNTFLNLHASMQIGERNLTGLSWTDFDPKTAWGNHREWMANEAKANPLVERGSPIAARMHPYDGYEFQLQRSRFTGKSWQLRVHVKSFEDNSFAAVYPAESDKMKPDTWLRVVLD